MVNGITALGPTQSDYNYLASLFQRDRNPSPASTICVAHLYHLRNCMASHSTPPAPLSGANDPVRVRRRQVAKYTLLANRIGYLLYALAITTFVLAFAFTFTPTMVTFITIFMVIGSILLAPSIVLGHAVKAAEREDRENGI